MPGATIADAAGGGLQAALAVMAALIGRGEQGPGTHLDVSIADGVLWLTSLAVDEHLATGAPVGPGHNIITGRYACYDTYRAADGGWLAVGAIEPKFFANLCRLLGCPQWIGHQLDDGVQDDIRADFRAAFATRDRDAWVAELAGADTCVTPVLSVEELVDDEQFGARHAIVEAVDGTDGRQRSGRGSARWGRCWPAWRRPPEPVVAGDPEPLRHRPSPAGGRPDRRADRRTTRQGGGGVSAIGEADIAGLIGVEQYEERGEFPVEQGYVWTTCSSVENGNPLFWDEAVAEEVTGGPIAPPTMVSVWFRPHHWAPDRTTQATAPPGPLRPEGGPRPPRGGDERQHHRLPRAGPARRPAGHPPDPAVGERREDHPAGHRPVLGHRRGVPQPARRAGGGGELHRLRLPPGHRGRRRLDGRGPGDRS